jgi:small-conductance mechanosensitive channel
MRSDSEFLAFFSELWRDLHEPDVIWQIVALAAALLAAALIARWFRGSAAGGETDHAALRAGKAGVRRVAFPLTALLLVFIARAALKPVIHVNLLNLAVPLLISLAVVRMAIHVLRLAFAPSGWLAASERVIATLVWGAFALHLTGLAAPLIDLLQSVKLPLGKVTIDLWMVLNGVVTIFATLLVALWIAGLFERRLAKAASLDSNLRVVFARLAKALLALVAVLFSLSLVGIDITTLSVFGGALGVGLGFGLQKIASNYVSGFIILLDRSIRIGNVIALDAHTSGVVTQITTRYTVVRTAAGTEVIVPNEYLVGNIVQNQSLTDTRVRLATTVQVAYETDLPRAMALLQEIAAVHARVLAEPAPAALVKDFADSGITLELGFWIGDPEEGTGNVRSDVNLGIWQSFREHGIEIPFPQRQVRLLGETAPAAQ